MGQDQLWKHLKDQTAYSSQLSWKSSMAVHHELHAEDDKTSSAVLLLTLLGL